MSVPAWQEFAAVLSDTRSCSTSLAPSNCRRATLRLDSKSQPAFGIRRYSVRPSCGVAAVRAGVEPYCVRYRDWECSVPAA